MLAFQMFGVVLFLVSSAWFIRSSFHAFDTVTPCPQTRKEAYIALGFFIVSFLFMYFSHA